VSSRAHIFDSQLGRFVDPHEQLEQQPLTVGYNQRALAYLAAPAREEIRRQNLTSDRLPESVKANLRRSQLEDATLLKHGIRPITNDHAIYRTMAEPVLFANTTAITGTSEALVWPAMFSSVGSSFFTVGRTIKLTAFGQISTGVTPGSITVTIRFGQTTGGTSLGASAATNLIASQTNITWNLIVYVQCRAIGSGTNGSLIAYGVFQTGTAIIASPAQFMVPASGQAAVGVDTSTSTGGIVVGMTLSNAGTSMVTSLLAFEALN